MSSISETRKEFQPLEVINKMDDETLKSITNKDTRPNCQGQHDITFKSDNVRSECISRDLQVQIAYEILNLERFVIFPVVNEYEEVSSLGSLPNGPKYNVYFGFFENSQYVPVNLNFLIENMNRFTPYQLMTLMEVDEKLYNEFSAYLPKEYILINHDRKEYVRLGPVDNSVDFTLMKSIDQNKQKLINSTLYHWGNGSQSSSSERKSRTSSTTSSAIEIRPNSFQLRFYSDKTIEYGSEVVTTNFTELNIQDEKLTQQQNYDTIVRQLYPLVDKYKSLPTFLLVEDNYIIPILFNPEHITELRYDKNSRVAWRPDLLDDINNPEEYEGIFHQKLLLLINYLGSREIINIITDRAGIF